MVKDVFTVIFGGEAGQGVKKAGSVASQIFIDKGLHVFQMDDYMSLIRGGHNFSVVSTSSRWLSSHYMKAELIVNFDQRSYDTHKNHCSEKGIQVFNSNKTNNVSGIGIPLTSEAKEYKFKNLIIGVGGVAVLSAAIGLQKEEMEIIIKREYPSGIKDNLSYATKIYDIAFEELGNRFSIGEGDKRRPIISGNIAIGMGAISSGLNAYYGYPMTPASSLLHFLASQAKNFNLAVVHPESELAVINMAIGSVFTGARTMVGSSGGGIALMSEGISLAGMAEVPILCLYSMRAGPATGVPTYTEQADLNFALSIGHGEFVRIVASPSTITEAYYLTSEMLDLVWKYQTPGILLTEKHLSESEMTVEIKPQNSTWTEHRSHQGNSYKRYKITDDGISPLLFPPSEELIKWNSYEHDELGITTEKAEIIKEMHEKRKRKESSLKEYLRNLNTVNIYGNSGPLIYTYGSTTMSVLEALKCGEIEATVVQPIYLQPFPKWELENYRGKSAITVEQSLDGQFSTLLKNKLEFPEISLINKYDGRPFDPIELSEKIKEVL
ncbi:MAG: 2-oxoacid:acceptor oxidoreductase subunit alpha [Candidatus Lokiarchaeota archaeon]|nr:2-oxoacid:acceptor oxidoreductase subunit alpha [Candidatus Lokiarchaeota archaeon]MBD3341559.1 2-oxoacid:acceptor oxidoreductase subunit alpha [Candidatus Lokiarchaeota archaeon]